MIIIVRTFAGLEEALERELMELGAEGARIQKRAVSIKGDKDILYKVNMYSRLALDVLLPIKKFKARNPEQLYNGVLEVNWNKYLDVSGTFSLSPIVYSKYFEHSQFPLLKAKDAIVDQFKERFGKRPDIEKHTPDLRITLRIIDDKCELLLNSSGAPLFKRGYRKRTGAAPLNEILAAAMVQFTGWDKKTPFIDPMCGSGTIPIEAGMYARNIKPCLTDRSYGFQNWKDYDADLFNHLYAEAEDMIEDNRVIIKGYDTNHDVISSARMNVKSIPELVSNVSIDKEDFLRSEKTFKSGILVFNPPYDKRIEVYNVFEFYNKIGTQLKHKYEGYDAWIISSHLEALKRVGLKPAKKITLWNGPDESKLVHLPLYRGTKKDQYEEN